MGKLTNYAENELLDHVMGNGVWNRPANEYVSLCTADPGETATGGTLTEPGGGSYARVVVDNNWDVASSRATVNSTLLEFVEATGAWGTLTHFAIVDSASGAGNVLAYGELPSPKIVTTGDNPTVQIGDLDISFDANGISTYLANKLLDHCFESTAYTPPTNIYIAALDETAVDGDSGTDLQAKEPTGVGAYARKLKNDWDAAASGLVDNTSICTLVVATASWGTISHFASTDHLTVGNVLFHAALDAEKAIGVGDTLKFPAGDCNFTLD